MTHRTRWLERQGPILISHLSGDEPARTLCGDFKISDLESQWTAWADVLSQCPKCKAKIGYELA